jgi:hypothetical protein
VVSSRKGRRVGGILLGSSIEEVLADIEHERRDRQDEHEASGEDDEDLAALSATTISC